MTKSFALFGTGGNADALVWSGPEERHRQCTAASSTGA